MADEDKKENQHVEYSEDQAVVEEKEAYVSPEARALGMSQELYDATYGINREKVWSKGHLKLYFVCSMLYLYSSMSGYDGSLMSSINVMTTFQKYYGLSSAGTSTGLIFSITSVASMAAAGFIWIADVIGRKRTIILGLIGTIVGIIMVSVSSTVPLLVGGRFVLFFFSAIGYVSVPLYLVEISPPNLRGSLAGLFNTFFYCGSTIATLATYGAKLQHGDDSILTFKIPFWCQMICPGLVLIGVFFCPESPRWLLSKGRVEEARAVLTTYHASGIEGHPIVEAQIAEMTAEIEASPLKTMWDYFNIFDLFTTRSKRYRMFLACSWSWFGNFTGSQVVTYYLPTMLKDLGVTSENTQLLLNAVYAISGWVAATSGALLHDVLGRRTMMLISTGGIIICFIIVSIGRSVYDKVHNNASSIVSITFIYVFGSVFAFAYTSMQPIYPAEVLTTHMRAKGMAFYQIIFNLSGFTLAFSGSIAMQNMGYWFYVFFVFWNSFVFVIIYFFFVETKGRTLEELEEVFQSENPRKASAIVKIDSPA
ncbi:hexose transporter Hxt17p [Trichomonascus vanleenenianus]|uniref:hexose transporter Hxt17p n=1 Tax=Trichomonascus vanleenenianus TaxID=2268995 RepID=UPI003ECB115F